MKLLLDSCVWGGVIRELTAAGHDVIWAGEWFPDPGDEEILTRAHAEGRVLVTIDKDFGELAVLRNLPHRGILRLVDLSVRKQASVCLHVLSVYEADLVANAIITAEPGRVRIRASLREQNPPALPE